ECRSILYKKSIELKEVKASTKSIGTGCECNTTPSYPEVEDLFWDHAHLGVNMVHIVMEYAGDMPRIPSAQQYHLLQLITTGHNVFFTGPGGYANLGCVHYNTCVRTGKSFILETLSTLQIPGLYATALTNNTASHINGMTIHS